ncbi:hypothetical protein SELMODRAFT_73443 [Selaginella moellendorffii]|uniref:SnoaL-like domain-containing protein n=1 Tax=Selaginella moellendorffii TaxID=88036 RepID=D8QMV9_SELML|nr:wound-induced protein 1 [Selaginella moellendorffii]XP_002967263.1 wound-induced protein 1 [Selaginella moellendorffii]EFJ31862.1 hypothetical protein SELMODRAFT_87660 [Selaginella moellendorffii]EFJ37996.1 hypothetical protein SELMODRAFT_73443 [Selaginella moellendorffii]|eukprot:XP_002960457.1 wound-induced protein 1 [Selaginella moellendorffii]
MSQSSASPIERNLGKDLASEQEGYAVLRNLYRAVSQGDVEIVKALVAADIEWWFHGPRAEQHLMRMLTGADRLGSIAFSPSRVCLVQDKFLAEGFLDASKSCWVHVFTIKSGKVVELREYFNTSVTVTGAGFFTRDDPLWESELTLTSMPGLIVAV